MPEDRSAPRGVPSGLPEAILAILRIAPGPTRRRALLEALEHRGHRVSLAGLNRALQYLAEGGLTGETADGVRAVRAGAER